NPRRWQGSRTRPRPARANRSHGQGCPFRSGRLTRRNRKGYSRLDGEVGLTNGSGAIRSLRVHGLVWSSEQATHKALKPCLLRSAAEAPRGAGRREQKHLPGCKSFRLTLTPRQTATTGPVNVATH